MKKLILSLLVGIISTGLFAQTIFELSDSDVHKIKSFSVLPDKNYSFQQVLSDTSLPFKYNDSLIPSKYPIYWIKVQLKNTKQYSAQYQCWVHPQINNTLYYYDANQKKWISENAGLQVFANKRLTGNMPIFLQANAINNFYIKVQLHPLKKSTNTIIPSIYLRKEFFHQKIESTATLFLVATVLIVLAFIFYHAYLYIHFKDKIYLYYIIIQLGGIVYLTGFCKFFNQLIAFKLVSFKLLPNGNLYFYDFNSFLVHLSIITILYGFVQLTRTYLKTQLNLPVLDKVSVIAFYVFAILAFINNLLTLSGLFYSDYYLVRYENIFTLFIMLLLLFIGFKALKKGVIAAKYFLLANTVPLGLMVALTVYFIIFKFNSSTIDLLPNLAVVSQAIAFAIAIVWRVSLIKEELITTQNQINTLQNQYEQLTQRNKYIELENKYIADEIALHINQKEELQAKLDANQRELASNTLYILQKNELMIGLQKQISQLAQQQATNVQKQVFKEMKSTLQNSVQLDNDWDKFKLHFEQVHPNFFTELEQKYPNLTPYEIRLSAYLHLQMTAKEIAALLNIDASSVHRAKTRLKKKLENTG